MIYSPQQIHEILKKEKESRNILCSLLNQWQYRLKSLEYSKRKELEEYISKIDNYMEANIELNNMLFQFSTESKSDYHRVKEHAEKMKKFIKNQGFDPNDLHWVNLNEI
jgi:DNA repair ATPase RecN